MNKCQETNNWEEWKVGGREGESNKRPKLFLLFSAQIDSVTWLLSRSRGLHPNVLWGGHTAS